MAKRARKKADPNETKSAKFSRLASARVTKAVKAIDAIGNLASRSYEYTEDQSDKIMEYLDASVKAVKARFAAPDASAKGETISI